MLSPPGDLLAPFRTFAFERRAVVVAAVSGGSDSTALLLLLKHHLERLDPPVRLVTATVDHGLRPEAAEEARAVGLMAARLGVEHHILQWTGVKPSTGVSAAAREARYRLLAQVARQVGSDLIVTAHTADDQAETVFMRRRRGDGMGLAGMAPATLHGGQVWIARPLLATRRQALRAFLRGNSVGWIDDPSNVDPRSERARARAYLNAGERAAASIETLLDLAKRSAMDRVALGHRAAALISTHAREIEPGLIRIDPDFLKTPDQAAEILALRVLLAISGGSSLLPDENRTADLRGKLGHPPRRATLSRTLIASRRDGIWLAREQRHPPAPQSAVDSTIWDGRFLLSADAPGEAWVLPFGPENAQLREIGRNIPAQLARAALAARPVIQAGGGQGWHMTPVAGPYARFLPSFDIALARAASSLIGAPAIADPPYAGHIVEQA